jgi:hypothetical protein
MCLCLCVRLYVCVLVCCRRPLSGVVDRLRGGGGFYALMCVFVCLCAPECVCILVCCRRPLSEVVDRLREVGFMHVCVCLCACVCLYVREYVLV